MELKEIFEFFKGHGTLGLIMMVILTILYLLFKAKWFEGLVEKLAENISFKKKEKKPTIKESDIKNHDIFNYIKLWMYSMIPTMQFSTDYRTVVFKKYMTLYLNAYKDILSTYINEKAFETMDEAELWNSIMTLISDIIYKYETDMANAGIPAVVIQKMKAKNADTITLTIDLLESICSSTLHNSDKNRFKLYSVLNILLPILEHTINNCVPVCNSINGQLAGLFYDGYTEPTKSNH